MRRRPARDDAPATPAVPPGAVTALSPAGRRPGRWELAVDGRVVGAVSVDLVDRLALRVGLVLTEPLAAEVGTRIEELAVYDRAVGMLAARARSSRDLRQRLIRVGASPVHADAAIARLQASGVMDDAAYARDVARTRVTTRGDSRRRVGQALAQAGVARAVADDAVEDVFDEESIDETALVEQAARKRLRTLGALEPLVARRRLFGYLARRGHDSAAVRAVVDRLLARSDTGDVADAGEPDGSDFDESVDPTA